GTSRLGGIEFAFENAAAGSFSAAFSISHDQGLLQPGSIVAAGDAFQIWDLGYATTGGSPFDSALLTLNYNPLLVDGNLVVYHQFDGQSVALTLGIAGSLGLNQYAILGDGLLQVRVSHFSEIVVTGLGGSDPDPDPDPDPQPVPEPSSLALLSIGGLIGALRLRRRRASQ
ncbi:MAG: PEP-CTERM sorting domain-containing protein, partial [Planctomycetaceae bacterium]|nr:PEP-CTERM sorting domain-containing protein [Planctomycetaceae bacterium]